MPGINRLENRVVEKGELSQFNEYWHNFEKSAGIMKKKTIFRQISEDIRINYRLKANSVA